MQFKIIKWGDFVKNLINNKIFYNKIDYLIEEVIN
jgi:hypothetical protein